MSAFKVYGLPHMTYVRTPLMILEEKSEAYDIVRVKPQSDELAGLHPFSRMPILDHDTGDGVVRITEGNAIAQYLNDVLDGIELAPDDAGARAQMHKWMNYVDAYYYPVLMRGVVFPRVINPKRNIPVDEAMVTQNIALLPHYLDQIEHDLEATGVLAGDAVSLADLALYPLFPWLVQTAEGRAALAGRDALSGWLERIGGRASVAATDFSMPD